MNPNEHGPLDVLLKLAAVRDDPDQERLLEQAIAESHAPARHQPDVLTAARYYIQQGLHVFPLKPGDDPPDADEVGKTPYQGSHGFKDATTHVPTYEAWFTTAPDSNIGVATGGLFDVIDVDRPDAINTLVRDTDAAWLHIRGITQTPRGGLHLWIPAVEGARNIQNNGTGIDYRGRGGYVVVPPSHINGTMYRWLLTPSL